MESEAEKGQLAQVVENFGTLAIAIATAVKPLGKAMSAADALLGIKPTRVSRMKRLKKQFVDLNYPEVDKLAQGYREMPLGSETLEPAKKSGGWIDALWKGSVGSKKGCTTTALEVLGAGMVGGIWGLGDLVGALRACEEINQATDRGEGTSEGALKLLAAVVPIVLTGVTQRKIETLYEQMYVSSVITSNTHTTPPQT